MYGENLYYLQQDIACAYTIKYLFYKYMDLIFHVHLL